MNIKYDIFTDKSKKNSNYLNYQILRIVKNKKRLVSGSATIKKPGTVIFGMAVNIYLKMKPNSCLDKLHALPMNVIPLDFVR